LDRPVDVICAFLENGRAPATRTEAGDQQYPSAAATASRHTCAGFM
jgi:hypothetical protein